MLKLMWMLGIILAFGALACFAALGRSLRKRVRPARVPPKMFEDAPAVPPSAGGQPASDDEPEAVDAAKGEGAPAPQPDEAFADEARKAAERVRRETSQAQILLDRERAAAAAKLQRARKMLLDSGLWHAIPDLYKEVTPWPSWSKRDDWRAPLSITDIAGVHDASGAADRRSSWVSWRWQDHAFLIALAEQPSWDGDRRGKLVLVVDEEAVLALSVSKDRALDYSEWRSYAVEAFVAGPWMALVAELAERLRVESQEGMIELLKIEQDRVDKIRF